MQDQQMRLLGMVESLSVSTQTALGGLDARLLALEAKMRTSLPGICIARGRTFTSGCVTKSGLQYSFTRAYCLASRRFTEAEAWLCGIIWGQIQDGRG